MKRLGHARQIFVAVALGVAVNAVAWSWVFACGFENASLAEIGRNVLSIMYPGSWQVRSAIYLAQRDGVLDSNAPAAPPWQAFARVEKLITLFKERIRSTQLMQPDRGLALVLIEPMLWTRFEMRNGELQMSFHADGPQSDDVVLVTDLPAVEALTSGKLEFERAEELGIVRVYPSRAAAP